MADGLKDNPFAALLQTDAKATLVTPKADDTIIATDKETNIIIEHIFLITLNCDNDGEVNRPSRCVFLEEVHLSLDQNFLSLDCLEQAVFERLMLAAPADYIVNCHAGSRADPSAAAKASESNLFRYLFQSYLRARKISADTNGNVLQKCISVTLTNAKLFMQHPEIFGENINPGEEFLQIFVDEATASDSDVMLEFFDKLVEEIEANKDEGTVGFIFKPVLDKIKDKFRKDFSLGKGVMFQYTDALCFFTRNPCLGQVLIQHIQPSQKNNGRSYEDSVLGALLAIHCLPKSDIGPYEFFQNPSGYTKQEHDLTESSIHQPLGVLNDAVYTIVYNLLKLGGDIKHQMMEWLGNCMSANISRAKMWTNMMPMFVDQMCASDGFFLNLCAVFLRLSKPFSQPCSPKLLKVQPTYCRATAGTAQELRQRNVHCNGLEKETMLIPCEDENEIPKPEKNYNFMTECFFMTHQCMHLGFHIVNEKMMKQNQQLHRIQQLYREIQAQGAENTEPGKRVAKEMEKGMTRFFTIKASMTQTKLLELSMDFMLASCTYLTQVATTEDLNQFQPLKFPLPAGNLPVLACLPEFIVENILDFLLFIRRFQPSMYQFAGDKIEHLMTLVLVFMGSPNRMKNPHLRAHMAEVLEALMPHKNDGTNFMIAKFHQEQLFHKHPQVKYVAETLLSVFVGIEMTGQGVEFEQKFNYRRPMYTILDYIWDIDLHRNAIKELAGIALTHIEDPDAPLFLRFINLLINDAIFLLDEAFQYMQQIKEKQAEKESGAWERLEPQQRQETERDFRHMTMLARFHNLMANDSIHSLELLTRENKAIFTHKVMVDRIVAMLNYFLLHLVGPKMKNLKVKNFEEYEFKPQETVSNICQIYLNLSEDESFCLAVSQDGRSYSPGLFEQADKVLQKIRKPHDMITKFVEFAKMVKAMSCQQEKEEELVADAPDEFLDPIMGTLMKEPVKLPSSGMIVDKATIQRHILSDQSDPFNRSQLTMDMVVPDERLKAKIQRWLEDSKRKQSS